MCVSYTRPQSWVLETEVYPALPEYAARFAACRPVEMQGLLESNFYLSRVESMHKGFCVFKSRFLGTVKNPNATSSLDKSRFVLREYIDAEAKELRTKSRTPTKNGTRVLLSVAASLLVQSVKLRDMSKAYTHADSAVQRTIVCGPPAELGLPRKYSWWCNAPCKELHRPGSTGSWLARISMTRISR